ncbi:Pentatricopeptide repeat-containing protein [Drosera capensis]
MSPVAKSVLPISPNPLNRYTELSDAYKVFDKMFERDSVSWSVVVGGFAKVGHYSSYFRVFREMVQSGIQPDSYTLPNMIRVCRDLTDAETGRLVHDVVCKFGMSEDPFWGLLLLICMLRVGCGKLFDRMPVKDLVTWTVMIGAYGKCGNAKESMVLFDRMREIGIFPDRIALSTVVNACGKLGSLHKAREVHDYICSRNISLDVILGMAMIDMYLKCGSVDLSRDIFEMMRERNVVTWSAMIAAYGYHGLGEEALELFSIMLQNRIAPNRVTFLSLLYPCSHAGLIKQGIRIFALMQEKYSIWPEVKHYTCMIDLFGRAARPEEAAKLIDDMEVERDEGVWSALLGACRIHRNYDLAKKAASSLLEMHPQNSGPHELLSNIYSTAQSWTKMAKIRELMTQRELKKVPGWTWIEVDSQIHQ